MKKIPKTLLTLAATATFAAATSCVAQTPSTGSGSPDVGWYTRNPQAASFKISTADELAGLATLVNRKDSAVDFEGKTIALTKDIDLSVHYGKGYNGGKGWIPIAVGGSFNGFFDGNGKTVRGLYINDTTLPYAGLFGSIIDGVVNDIGTIKNIGVVNVDICGGDNVGGVVGCLACSDEFTNGGSVANSYTTGTVRGNESVGGVVGNAWNSSVSHSYSAATVSGNDGVGGVVGVAGNSNVHNCYSTGAISGGNSVGGVVGGGHDIAHCYSTGNVSGDKRVGGVVGALWASDHDGMLGSTGEVFNSYSVGAVSGKDSVGGIAGAVYGGKVAHCAALNPSVKSARSNVGRVVGVDGSIVWTNHADFYTDENGTQHEPKEITYRTVLSGNFAFAGTINNASTAKWSSRGTGGKDGADIAAAAIAADGTLGGFSTAKDDEREERRVREGKVPQRVWTTKNGKLPGLGAPVEMPEHLKNVSKGGALK